MFLTMHIVLLTPPSPVLFFSFYRDAARINLKGENLTFEIGLKIKIAINLSTPGLTDSIL